MKNTVLKTIAKRFRVFAAILAAVMVASMILAGCGSQQSSPPLATTAPSLETTPTIIIDGNLKTPTEADLFFDTYGTVQKVMLKKGDKVTVGMLLASLDDTAQQLAVDKAQNDVTIAKNQFEKRVCGIFIPGPHYDYINVPGASDTLESIGKEVDNAASLLENSQYQAVRSALSLIRDDVLRAKQTLDEKYILSFKYGLDEATAIMYGLELKKAELALTEAKEEAKKALITAPISGTVSDVTISVGDHVTQSNYGVKPVIHLVDTSNIEMEGSLDELDAPKVFIGQEAQIAVDAYPGAIVKGRVSFISPAPTIRSGVVTYLTIISVESARGLDLRGGMSASARITIK